MGGNFLAMQSEEIILDKDYDEYTIQFNEKPSVLMVQVYTEEGTLKNVKVINGVISPSGKTSLKKGDVIKYIAVF